MRKPMIAFEPVDFDKKEYKVRRSNPKYWKNDGVRQTFKFVYAPNFPEIEIAYQEAGIAIYRPDGEQSPDLVAEQDEKKEKQKEAAKEIFGDVTATDRDPDDVQDLEQEDEEGEDSDVEEPVQEHWSELAWPKMRSLAAEFSEEPVMSKKQAEDILKQAESEGKL